MSTMKDAMEMLKAVEAAKSYFTVVKDCDPHIAFQAGWLARAEAEVEMVSVPTWHLVQLRAAFNSLSGHVLHITGGAFYDSNGVDIRCSPWTELASTADWLGHAIERLPAPPKEDGE